MEFKWSHFQEAVGFVISCGIDVFYRGSAESIGSPISVNGCAFIEDNIIDLYADNPTKDVDLMTACLIHEFGHIMADRIYKDLTEQGAWLAGMEFFPKHLIPPCTKNLMDYCLTDYAKYGIL